MNLNENYTHPDFEMGTIPQHHLAHQVFDPVYDGGTPYFWLFDADQLAFKRLRGLRRDYEVPGLPLVLRGLPMPGEGWPESHRPFVFRNRVFRWNGSVVTGGRMAAGAGRCS